MCSRASGEAYHPAELLRAAVRRRAELLTSYSCCLFFHLLRVVSGACGAVHLRPVVESLLGRLDLIYVSAPDLHRLSLQRPRVGEGELPRQDVIQGVHGVEVCRRLQVALAAGEEDYAWYRRRHRPEQALHCRPCYLFHAGLLWRVLAGDDHIGL